MTFAGLDLPIPEHRLEGPVALALAFSGVRLETAA